MNPPAFTELKESIEYRLGQTSEILEELEYEVAECSADEFYGYISRDAHHGKAVTIRDIIGNEYLMFHEVVEVSELKRLGVPVGEDTHSKGPREKVYEAHLSAMEFELEYALLLEDYYWLKHRLDYHGATTLKDKNLGGELKERAQEIYDHYKQYSDS
ncbi:hypothetical protein A3K69_08390 [Candidatus Bathyarchaeota archaeon RBG_16_57_9]|jgi:hypothetical protein|nr:MAG: hypothetical protein A3K69_08390 [Candidatus Bathyarchaeota archaeon RBG_16_57_9]